jgi:hypothetical protein
MRQLIDLVCDKCGEQTERFISTTTVPCHCGGTARKIIGMPRVVLEGITGAFPGAHERWAKIREDNARQKARKRDSD